MAENKKPLTSARPTWHFDSSGKKLGLWVQCPKCKPEGSCVALATWSEATTTTSDANLVSLNVPVPRGNSVECQLTEARIKDGFITWK